MRLSRLLCAFALSVLAVTAARPASASDVLPGYDFFEAVGDLSNHSFGDNPIPPNFFDPGSDPFTGPVQFLGGQINPLSACPEDDLFGIDAVIRRIDPAVLPAIPSSDQIPIEIVELRLVSSAPITVTYGGGGNPEDWMVTMELTPSGPQPPGQQWFFHDLPDPDGGASDMYLPVLPKFTFTRISDNAERVLDYALSGPIVVELFENGAPWVHNTPPLNSCTSNLCMSPGANLVLTTTTTTLVLQSRCPQPPVQSEARTWGSVKGFYR